MAAVWCGDVSPPAHPDVRSSVARGAPSSQPGLLGYLEGATPLKPARAYDLRLKLEFGDVYMARKGLELRHSPDRPGFHFEFISLPGPAQHQWNQLRLDPDHGDGPGITLLFSIL